MPVDNLLTLFFPAKRRFHIHVLVIAALFTGNSAYANFPHWQQSNYIAESFFKIALNSKYRNGTRQVIKWNKDINFYVDHRHPDRELHNNLTNMHLGHLSRITGLNINQTRHRSAANLIVIFSREQNMARDFMHAVGLRPSSSLSKTIRSNVCLAYTSYDAQGRIHRATVLIAADKAREKAGLVSCIVEELSEVLGLPNDSDKVFPSIFNDRSSDALLTGLDYLMLKMLYDRRIKPGMTRQQLVPVISAILGEYRRYNIIGTAEQEVRKCGLYRMMDYS